MVKNVNGATVITGKHVQIYRLLVFRKRLELEIAGMKPSGRSASAILKEEFGWKGNRQNILGQLNSRISYLGG